ncbi:DUF1289 domain-containing protein [Palleronia abyssalis]|uniref:Fe-S protein n=1 Tax=Palleronia abyssalis TaxID=1501240 RepID=A0A2R8BQW5_9RHOB|nr:DUF1289 domain-containing protein [Palleronia abyssalis]SPJ22476.1 hypothetical protein PAA8504_00270 [Palleronia abyssalis]
MEDETTTAPPIETPCINVCVIHPAARLCTGCLRTMDEITSWRKMTPAERSRIMAELPGRQGQLHQRRGGRARNAGQRD